MTLMRDSKKSFYDGISNNLNLIDFHQEIGGSYLRKLFHRPPALFILLKEMEICIPIY